MKKYTLKQEYGIVDESGQVNKQFDCNVTIKEQGMSKENILNFFRTVSCGFVRLLGEESGTYGNLGHWPDFGEMGLEINETLKYDDETPIIQI